MRHWKTKLTALCAAAAMLLPMTGCSLTASAEELFTLPEFPVEYTGLSNQLNALLGQGYEYVSPSSGRNIQSVQMTDLNGDGYEEAVAFFRAPSGEKPLKIVIFRPTEDSFEQLCTIESSGSAINRVSYQDLNGDGTMELVVGWRISADVQTVTVYEIAPDPVVLMQSSYQSAILQDLDGDGVMDLLVIHAGTKGNGVMDFYHWQVSEQKPVASDCALSSTMAELSAGSFIAGELSDGTPAAFITGVSSSQQAVTDAVIWSGDKLVNVSLPRGGSVSRIAADYQQWKPQDINSDGITELPSPQTPAQERTSGDDIIRWAQVSKSGSLTTVDCTYHSLTGGWYFRLPQSWWSRTSYTEGAGELQREPAHASGGRDARVYDLRPHGRKPREPRPARQPHHPAPPDGRDLRRGAARRRGGRRARRGAAAPELQPGRQRLEHREILKGDTMKKVMVLEDEVQHPQFYCHQSAPRRV